ncbi:hypothetical protein N8368_02435 [Bacteroidia bacterium]|nr:hypothetical protein [Bacteroidia bacterium]MDB4107275.1 hypothetical protein [Bacteroidia bacterium]MDB9882409.1 hypothetical protein [Bacteroidia bacterium]MDC1395346.1 hypothetical protein [Bacteroidia bacterium]
MQQVTEATKKTALRILVSSFGDNPGALWVIKKKGNLRKRLAVLCLFCLEVSMQKQGAYLTTDNNGVALIFKNTARQNPFKWIWGYIQLGNKCIGWDRAYSIIRRERTIQGKRPKREHLYFWMLAVENNSFGLSTIIEIRDFTYQLSQKYNLPIYAETSLPKNRLMYERYGFKVYDTWIIEKEEITLWFLAREPIN